jgi:predicted esterase YcpF (UPF0227 family)
MPNVLYLHGFASSPASAKIAALRPLLEPDGIHLHTPDLNVPSFERMDFDAVVEHAAAEGRAVDARAVVGSSLGALVALSVVQRGLTRPLVLIAPALGVADRWSVEIPEGDPISVFNHARNANAPIHRAFFLQMCRVRVDEITPPVRVIVIMGRLDETVSFSTVQKTWERWRASGALAEGSKFVEIEDGDHGLVASAEVIAAAIREVCR